MSIPDRGFHIRPVKDKPHENKNMKTKLFLAALTLISLLLAAAPLPAQTVTWERKALGQQQTYPCAGSNFNWPNNNAWTQDQRIEIDTICNPDQQFEAEPSNWSTPSYPNGASVNVILGNVGGAPTSLDRSAPITLHSLTVLSVGGLNAEYGSRLTVDVFDFQGDGTLSVAGGGGPAPTFNLTAGGTLKKSGGSGTYTFNPAVFLQVLSGGTIACEAGTLQLPSQTTTYAGGVNFNAAAGAVIDLAPAEGGVVINGQFTGSNVGGTVRLKEGYLSTLAGSGGATFNFAGNTFQWQGGAIESSPTNPFINAGTMNITGTPFLHGQGFINQGLLAQSGTGAFNVPSGRVLTNAASGIFDIRNNNGLTGLGGGGPNPFFNNYGTLRKSAGTGTSVIDQVIVFNNIQGTIRVDTGTLVFARGMTTRDGTGDGGTFVVAPGATLQLTDGTNDAVYHGTYTGSGGGTILMSGGYIPPDDYKTGVIFNFPGAMFQWTGGAIGGYQNTVPVTNAGTITVAGSANKATFGYFNNNGTILHTGSGSLAVSAPNGGGIFSNNPGATYDLQSDADVAYGAGLNNFGLFKKSAGAGISAVEAPFHNAGVVEVNSGSIQFAQFNQTGGMINFNGGNITFTNEAVFDGGSVVGTGTITGSVRNNGATFAPGFSPGKITVSGNFIQGANGTLNMEIGGAAPGTQYDQLQVSGTATLGGTLNVSSINGFQPAKGATFQLVLAGSFSGTFSTINTTGFTGAVTYSSSGITITVTSTPSPTPSPTATPSPTSTPTPTPAIPAQLLNISTRMHVGTDPNQLIGGFILTGTEPKKVIVLATGPSLEAFGLSGVLADPILELYQGDTLIATNDNWEIPAQAEIEATGVKPGHRLESALVRTLAPGAYTAVVRGTNGTGVGTVQVYDLSQSSNSKLANISSRGFVQVADDRIMIAGVIIGGNGSGNSGIVVRAIAPSLKALIPGVLSDPTLELKDENGSTLVANDDWQQSPQAADIVTRGLAPSDIHESAVGVSLSNGAYTAIVRGKNGETGVAVVEVYNVQ
jgi:hypothetical protein